MWGEGNGTPLQHSCLENPMDRGAWKAAVYGVIKSRTRLSHFTFTFRFHALEKEMATHSSVLARRIPGTGEPGGLLSMGWHRVGHAWSNLAAATAMSWPATTVCCGARPGVWTLAPLLAGCVTLNKLLPRSVPPCPHWFHRDNNSNNSNNSNQ